MVDLILVHVGFSPTIALEIFNFALKTSISLEIFNLDLQNSQRKIGPWWVVLEGDLEFFNLWVWGRP